MHAGRLPLSRRRLIAGTGLALAAAVLPRAVRGEEAEGFRILRARPGKAALRGRGEPPTAIWGYEGQAPGPVLRVRRGQELKVRLVNELPEETVIHWHGVRVPNRMDGVPHLTQAPVAPGQSFDYRFAVPDAGTFWYHSHRFSSEQQDRGLYGGLIVEEPEPVDVDRDVLLILDDWRLTAEGGNDEASFRSFHDAAHAGRLGRHFTVNGGPSLEIPVKTNERVRLRLVNAANARVMPLRLERHAARVMAIDGQPAEPFLARESRVTLGPGNRADLFVDMTSEPGASAPLVLEDVRGDVPLVRLVYESGAPAREAPRGNPGPLPANPLPERMNFPAALRLEVPLEGGAMSPVMMRRGEIPGHGIDPMARIWTMAGKASSGHDGPPLFSVKRGRAVVLAMPNRSAFPHAMHLHGHHFRLLDKLDDGWKPFWLDTVVIDARDTARIAFVADNPGRWMIHCHMLEHQETGMAAWFEVT